MPKRKRDSSAQLSQYSRPSNTLSFDVQYARLERLIEIGQKTLHDALKLARGFERQKLGRRQKTAQAHRDQNALTRLSSEVHALKGMDIDEASRSQLQRQLSKVKRIQETPTFQHYISRHPLPQNGPPDKNTITVLARLMNSNPVKGIIPGIIDDIREALGVRSVGQGTEKTFLNSRCTSMTGKDILRESRGSRGASDVSDASGWEGFSSAEDIKGNIDHEESTEESNQYEHLIANSDSDSIYDSENDKAQAQESRLQAKDTSKLADMNLPSSIEEDVDVSNDRMSESNVVGKGSKRPVNTTFLPSLMGGYWSGSESGETEDPTPLQPKLRKNRMGQQARRALWERKYGDKANHLRKENRDSGWDLKRGATDNADRTGRKRGNSRAGKNHTAKQEPMRKAYSTSKSTPGKHLDQKSNNGSGTLHPSWVAAKKTKEQKHSAMFQGKKIIF